MAALPHLGLALAAVLLTGVARAGEVHTHLTGQVTKIEEDKAAPGTIDLLAAQGVTVGASVSVDYVIESTTPGQATGPFTEYFDAVTSMSVSIGTYEAHFDPVTAVPLNVVQVGNDVSLVKTILDSYAVNSSGTDTDKILQSTNPLKSTVLSCGFSDPEASTLSDEDLIQDVGSFPFGLGFLQGENGTVMFTLDVGSGGPGTGDPSGLARKGQMIAAAKFGQAVLKIKAKFAAAPPDKDPFGAAEAEAIDKAQEKFIKQFVKATDKAIDKGGTAPLGVDAVDSAATLLLDGFTALADSLLTGADLQDKLDRGLRGKLIRAAGSKFGADLKAQGKHAFKPDARTLGEKLSKSHDKLVAKFEKALTKAEKQGVVYTGATAEETSDAVSVVVDAFVQLTAVGDV